MFAATRSRPTLLARFTALVAILMVLALTVLASSPELHAKVHGHEAVAANGHSPAADGDEDGCVVTLFAQGIVALLAFLCLACSRQRVRRATFTDRSPILPASPGYLFLPTQAPPAA